MKYLSAPTAPHILLVHLIFLCYPYRVTAGDLLSPLPLGYTYVSHHFPQTNPLVIELREKIQGLPLNPFLTTDKQLARHLEATNYDVDHALARLQRGQSRSIPWNLEEPTTRFRKAVRADELLTWTPPDFMIWNLPIEQSGYTDDGNPVYLIPFGRWNFGEFFRQGGRRSELFYYVIRFMEEANNCTLGLVNPRTGWPVDQVTLLIDAKGYSVYDFLHLKATWTLVKIFRAVSRHYPFTIKLAIVVNAPVAFKALWKLTRVFSSTRARTSYLVFSRFNRDARNALVHHFPINTIPIDLGGTYVPLYDSHEGLEYDVIEHYSHYPDHIEPSSSQYVEHTLAKRNTTEAQMLITGNSTSPVKS
ncbi:unnamed protein product [Allacma fusca]|uniref:CRAL-TRIO domain-containing protein n=1 Tax=Allacma fusca TaxID=39272 RepID=A0A8J2P7F2_9HEXA|nr:unnamed protein product [Allacma fusca]